MKNKTINKIIFTVFIAISAIIFSCSDSFVEQLPEYSIDSENFFNSEDDYYQGLIAAYDLLQTTYANALVGEFASDNTLCGGESATDVIGWQQIDDMIHTEVNSNLRDIWNWMFAGVQRTNYFMEFKDKTDFEGKDEMIAEVRFLRAYYLFELVKFFGPVPLKVDARYNLGDELIIPRAPVEATNYNSMFEFEGENGPESVFEVQYTDVEGAGFDCLQCSEGNVAVGFSGVRGYVGPLFTPGFSFNVPTQEAVDEFEPGDLRKDVAILDIVAWAEETGAEYTTGFEHTGYFNRKYLPRVRSANAQGDLNLTNPNNYRAIRYADVLLMAAEAYNRGGIDDAKAQEYINLVRRRAFGDEFHDLTVTGAALTDAIYHERRVELMGEGHHFFDLVRTGRAADEIDGFVAGQHEVFPVPLEEIEFSAGNWSQNPNY